MRPSRAAASLLRQQRRPATTSRLLASSSSPSPSPVLTRSLFTRKTPAQRIKGRIWTATGIVLGGLFAVYAYDSSAGVHRWLFTPLLHAFTKDDPEASHKFAIKVLKSGLSPVDVQDDQDVLAFELWGKRFSNPVGLAAGFDKHAEAIDGLFNLGFSYVEIGSVTPEEQPGNPQPRMFRLPESQSVINRYGFNSDGHLAVLERLRDRIHAYLVKNARLLPATTFPEQPISANPITDPVQAILANNTDTGVLDNLGLPRSLLNGKILAINLGKNKLSAPEAVDDYVAGVQTLGPYADVLVVNVSSPNTPGLRSLQKRGIITDLLSQVIAARDGLKGSKPVVLLKIAPDLSRQEVADIGRAAKETKVDGIIVSNTTISRPASAGNDSALNEAGGLSGPPLKPLSIRTLQTLYALTSGSIPLIGCGGISSGADALDYAKAGASFVQLYTALGYQGVGLPRMIKDEIAVELQKDNKTWKDIIGSGVDLKSVQQLGRDVNPVNVLGLEGDESGFSKLKREIEDVLAGRSPVSPVQPIEQDLPDWEDSPAFNGRAASSALPSSSHSESGLIPEGYPQIIIVETPPKYAPAPLWTKKDVDEKLAQGKELVHKVEDKLADATQATKEILQQTKDNAVAVAHDIADDELARRVKDVTAEVTRQTTENFKKLGKDIKNDEFAKEVKDTTEAILKQTKDNFVTVGRKIRDEGHAGQAVQSFVDETFDKTRAVAHSIVNDGEFSKAISAFTSDVVRETIARSKALGKAVRDEGHFSEAVQSVVQETLARSKALAHSIKHDGPNYSEEVKTLTQDVVNETVARSRKLGQHIVEDGDFVDSVKETSNSIVQEALARSRQLGRSIRGDGDLPGIARDTAESIALDASVKTQRIADDIKSDSFLEEVKQAFRQATENFKHVGRDIKHDPLLHQQVNLDEAKREVQRAKAGLKEGPTGEDQRNGSGLFKLFGTFGERANVTSESKRLV